MRLSDRITKVEPEKPAAALLKAPVSVLNGLESPVLNAEAQCPKFKDRHKPGYQKEYQRVKQREYRAKRKAERLKTQGST